MPDPSPSPAPQPPNWVRLIPDNRSLVTVGMFALAWRMLEMVDGTPSLLTNPAFMTLATLVVGGSGLGAAVSYFYGSSRSADKQTADTVATLSSVATSQQQRPFEADAGAPTPPPDPAFKPET